MGRRYAAIRVVIHEPKTEEGKRELKQRTSCVHADAVRYAMEAIQCPEKQREELLSAILDDVATNWKD